MIDKKPHTAREAAAFTLFSMAEDGAWSDGALHYYLSSAAQPPRAFPPRDAALATRLVYGTVQNAMLCDWYLRQFSKVRLKKLEPRVLACLRMGIYQLVLMDRIPVHAAVGETVSLVRRHCRANDRAVSFTNAVLRSIARAVETGTLPRLNCPDKESYYSLRYSHPEWLVRLLAEQYGLKDTEAVCKADNADSPVSVRVNLLKSTPEGMRAGLERAGVSVTPHGTVPEILLCSGGDLTVLPAFREGKITIQDAAGAVVTAAAAPEPGMFVLDCCAAPGGKSFGMAERMQNTGQVVACDIYEHKLKQIEEGASRLGLTNITTQLADAVKLREEWRNQADLVLCDAPCSGFGIIRKKPEIRYRDAAQTEQLPALQKQILQNCSQYVKPGGILVYSTCTILKRENDEVVRAFLTENPMFEAVCWTHPVCGECPEGCVTLLPHLHNTDGFFIAKLRKKV